MRVSFTKPKSRGSSAVPENLLAEAEVFFDAMTVDASHPVPSPFASLKLVGFGVWTGDRGIFVTFPSRAFGMGSERRFFDYLRAADPGDSEAARSALYRVKRWIADEYKAWAAEGAKEPVAASRRTAPNGEEF